MEAALHAIRFFTEQQQLMAQYEANVLNSRFAKMQHQCKAKLEQVHAGYLQAKRKYQETVQAKTVVEQDNAELQSKYTQKAMCVVRMNVDKGVLWPCACTSTAPQAMSQHASVCADGACCRRDHQSCKHSSMHQCASLAAPAASALLAFL